MKQRHQAIPAVYLILRQQDKVLLLERANTGYQDGFLALPAGHVEGKLLDPPDTPIAACIREGREELGIEITAENLIHAHTMYRFTEDGQEYIDFFFEVRDWEGEVFNAEPDKSAGLIWVAETELGSKQLMQYTLQALMLVKEGVGYSEYDCCSETLIKCS